jgi:cardiolipin synthase
MEPQWLSKINTFLQLLLVVSILWLAAHEITDHWFGHFIIYAVTLSTISSGISYIWTWGGRALRNSRRS